MTSELYIYFIIFKQEMHRNKLSVHWNNGFSGTGKDQANIKVEM